MKSARRKSEFMLAIAVLFVGGFWACESAFAGRLVAWGWNDNGQCDVPSGNDFIAIAAKWKHNLALRADGSIAGWGHNNHGQADPLQRKLRACPQKASKIF
jgi:alpha-tubulin suppressor-like RCC1 family protein